MIEIEPGLASGQILSRYMSLAKFASLLQTGELFFSALTALADDPHEGSSTFLNEAHESGLLARLAKFANVDTLVLGTAAPETPEQVRSRAEIVAESERERFVETVFGSVSIAPGQTHKQIIRSQRQWLDVSCWHAGADESLAMWRIYGGMGESVCICTDVGRLAACLKPVASMRGYIGRVQYIDLQKDYFKADHPLTPALHKRMPFSYEQEVRAIVWDPLIDPLSEREGVPGSLVRVDLVGLISRVRVSPTAPDWCVAVVERLSETVFPGIRVERSGLDAPPLFSPNGE